jgi:hypothetical protein
MACAHCGFVVVVDFLFIENLFLIPTVRQRTFMRNQELSAGCVQPLRDLLWVAVEFTLA